MGLIKRVANSIAALQGKSTTTVDKLTEDRFFGNFTSGFNITDPRQTLDFFSTVSYIGFCANKRAKAIARSDFQIQDADNNPIEGLEVEALLRSPEARIKRWQFIYTISLHLDLDGNAFILKDHKNVYSKLYNKPSDLCLITPTNVYIYDEMGRQVSATMSYNTRNIGFYRVRINNQLVDIPPENMLHINAGNPVNLLRGMGIVQRNGSLLERDRNQSIFNQAFFERGVLANILLTMNDETEILESDYKKTADDFRATYGRGKEPIMIAPPGFKVSELNISHRDIQFIEQQRMTKEDILMAFEIPRGMGGLENQYVAKDEDKIAWEDVLADQHSLISESITEFIREYEERDDLFYVPQREQTINMEREIKRVDAAIKLSLVKRSVAQNMLGIEGDIEPAEDIYLSSNQLITLDNLLSGGLNNFAIPTEPTTEPEPPQEPEEEPSEPPDEEAEEEADLEEKSHRHADHKKLGAKRYIMNQSKRNKSAIARQMLPKVKDQLQQMFGRVMAHLDKMDTQKSTDYFAAFDWDGEKHEMKQAAVKMFTAAYTVGINKSNDLYGSAVSTEYHFIKTVVERLADRYVDQTLPSRKETLNRIVSDTLSEGGGIDDIRKTIQDTWESDYTGENAWQAERIARTEASNAYDQANFESYKDIGVETVDVVGCEDDIVLDGEEYGCNSTDIPLEQMNSVLFHPNHTGVFVPSQGGQ